MDVPVNPKQYAIMTSQSKVTIYVAGIGSGKSLVEGMWILERAKVPGSLGLAVSTDYNQLKTATLPRLQEAWAMLGYHQGVHYVVNKKPPRKWRVPEFTPMSQMGILTWRWGSYLLLGGTERYETHRGPQLDYIAGDEVRGWRDIGETIKVFLGRLRGDAYKVRGLISPLLLVTSPLDDPEELSTYFGKESVKIVRGTTLDNLANLPEDYVSTQEGLLDDISFRREVLGEDVPLGGLYVAYNFVHELYPKGNLVDLEFDPGRDARLKCDFNSSQLRPMSWTLSQDRIVNGRMVEVTLAEFVNRGTSTETQSEILFDWLSERGFRATLHIRGDATGGDKARNSVAARSDYEALKLRLRKTDDGRPVPWKVKDEQTRRTRRVKDRIRALTARFQTRDGQRHLLVDRRCKKLLEAFKRLKWAENGVELEDNEWKDLIDAESYGAYYDYPVHQSTPTITRR